MKIKVFKIVPQQTTAKIVNYAFLCLRRKSESMKIVFLLELYELYCSETLLSCKMILQEKEKELDLQRSMNQELDMALRLLEKDIHEKQDTVIQLRKQLDDIKTNNLEMYNKLQVSLIVKHMFVALV